MSVQETTVDGIVRAVEVAFNTTERFNAEAAWSIISEFLMTNQSGLFDGETVTARPPPIGNSTPGGKKTQRVFDSTGGQANRDLAAAIHSTLTNPATRWSKLRFMEEELNNDNDSVFWLENLNNIIFNEVLNESNFDNEIGRLYPSYTGLANGALFHENPTEDGNAVFTAIHMATIAWEVNHNNVIDTIYRKFNLTAKQALLKFRESATAELKKVAAEEPDLILQFIHTIFPRDKSKIKLNDQGLAPGKSRPFAEFYVVKTFKQPILESGYYEFPVYCVRWDTLPGEVYGRGPGHLTIPDVRTLNRHVQLTLKQQAIATDPPRVVTQRDVLGSLDLSPGSLSVMKNTDSIKSLVSDARFDVANDLKAELRNQIKTGFFLDKLLLPPRTETGEMTATETRIRTEQMQRVLGPTISRLNTDLLSPLITRVVKDLVRRGRAGQLPQLVQQQGLNLDIIFVNPLARSQQFSDISNILGWIDDASLIAQLVPDIVDNIDGDGIMKHLGKVRGIPEAAITNDEKVKEIREQRAQAAEQQQKLDAGTQLADIGAKLGGASGASQ